LAADLVPYQDTYLKCLKVLVKSICHLPAYNCLLEPMLHLKKVMYLSSTNKVSHHMPKYLQLLYSLVIYLTIQAPYKPVFHLLFTSAVKKNKAIWQVLDQKFSTYHLARWEYLKVLDHDVRLILNAYIKHLLQFTQ